MPEAAFRYRALDASGRNRRGSITAVNRDAAFDELKASGLSPLSLTASAEAAARGSSRVSDRDIAAFVADLAALLRAGADMRSALAIVSPKGNQGLALMVRQMNIDISGGAAVDQVFTKHLPAKHAFIAALVTAGEASGDLAGGLERGAEMLESQLQARDQLVSILSYPMFVLVSAIVAFLVILLVVIPSIGPLARAPGADPSSAMKILLSASDFVRGNLIALVGVVVLLAVAGIVSAVMGLWAPTVDRLFFRGPLRGLAGSLVYGGFAVALGGILAAGAPMADALKLAIRATRSPTARDALEPLLKSIREGHSLSAALSDVRGFPKPISRLAVIGEQSGALGPMLLRAGRLEERKAIRAIETAGRIVGPALIVSLGGLIGLLMAGLLSGVSSLGAGALN